MTLSSGFYIFLQGNAQYPGLLMASAIVAALPIVIVFILPQSEEEIKTLPGSLQDFSL
jgi:ABC-type glycerol-3-phosphate transport system permease component